MAKGRAARLILFVAGLILVIGVLAAIYVVKPRSGSSPAPGDLQKQDPHAEIASLEAMWKEHPNHAPIALELGNLCSETGQPEKAVLYYREFLKLDTSANGWEIRLDIAKALYALGKPAEAKTEVQWILDRDPDHAGALYNMGAIEANTGNGAMAKLYWKQLIAKHPQDSLAHFAEESLQQLQ